MKFALVDTYRYWWPVAVSLPDPSRPGKIVEQSFKVEFEAEDRDAATARIELYDAMTPKEKIAHEHDLIRSIVKNWDEITEADNKTPVAFSPERLEQALRHSWFRIGVYNAYGESLRGEAAKLGN